jgi:hypothetical protein
MLSDPPNHRTAEAVALVQKVGESHGLSTAAMAPIIRAVAQDLEDAADKAARHEARLTKLEKQTRVLAEALLAITETPDALVLSAAIKAVKDEM